MNQREFTERYEASWTIYEKLLNELNKRKKSAETNAQIAHFPYFYRRLSQQLALARDRDYSPALVERLNNLVLRGYHELHRTKRGSLERIALFILVDFPVQIRRDIKLFWLATALLYLPALVMIIATIYDNELLYAVLDPETASRMAQMYDPESSHFAKERDSDSDFYMFGHYIRNNIGIGFQTFASGLLLGLGSMFYLVFNGIQFGAVTAHLYSVGFGKTFLAFVITHGAFELTAIVIAGMAGLKLGFSLLAPGRRTRVNALVHAARESATLVFGLAAMLLIAAFVEAFWSSSNTVPAVVKYIVGSFCWLMIIVYIYQAGRNHGS